jgi:hypothetical protein
MAEKHPDEIELLSFVEDELDADARRGVAEHLLACRACSDQIHLLEAGRSALQAAPLLELPSDRREAILASLPERPDPWRLLRPLKRPLVIAAPVAGAAALVGVFVLAGTQLGPRGDDSDEAARPAQEAGGGLSGGGQTTESGDQTTESGEARKAKATFLLDAPEGTTFVRAVQGPPDAVVRTLGSQGIQAAVDAKGRVRAEARRGDVAAALAGRPPGKVVVYVR